MERTFDGAAYGYASGRREGLVPDAIEIIGMDGYILRPFTEATIKPLAEMFVDYPRMARTTGVAMRALVAFEEATETNQWQAAEEAVRSFVMRRVNGRKDGSLFSWVITNPSGAIIGGTNLWPTPSPFPNTYEMGVFVRPDYWGKDVAVNAVRATGAIALDDLGAQRLEMTTDEANRACRRLCEKLGFTDEGFVRRMQYGMESPTKVWTRWYTWNTASLREPAPAPERYVHQTKRRVARDFEPERFLAERQFEILSAPETARDVITDARSQLVQHFGDPKTSAESAYEVANSLRTLVFGAAARIWTLMALQTSLGDPAQVVDALRNPVQKPSAFWGNRSTQTFPSIPVFKNSSIPKFEMESADGKFHNSTMELFTRVRIAHMECVPEYQPLLDLCTELQNEWRVAAVEAGKLDRLTLSNPASERLSVDQLREGQVDPLSGTISDALVTLDFIFKHAPVAAARASAQMARKGPARKRRFTNDDLQRAILRSHPSVTGVLVELSRTKMEKATGKGLLGQERGPFRADELAMNLEDPFNPTFYLTGQGLHVSPHRVPRRCPADSDLPGANVRERYTIAASRDDGVRLGYLSEAKAAAHTLSTEEALLRTATLFMPLLWGGLNNSHYIVGVGKSITLASQQLRDWETTERPRSAKDLTWGMGPITRLDIANESSISLPTVRSERAALFGPGFEREL
jgi:RimJ/RimL family protein N-acetyltransferase